MAEAGSARSRDAQNKLRLEGTAKVMVVELDAGHTAVQSMQQVEVTVLLMVVLPGDVGRRVATRVMPVEATAETTEEGKYV